MYNNVGPQLGVPQFQSQLPTSSQPNVFGRAFNPAGSGLIQSGLVAYVEKVFGSIYEIVQKIGNWTRIAEPVGGRLSYKPPIHDINAPDLYIPLMTFGTYIVLAGISLGLRGKFSPGAVNWLFIKGLIGWSMQTILLKVTLLKLGSGDAPLLDIIAYSGYTFPGLCLGVLGRIIAGYSYYILFPWTCLCMGIFMVKTMNRILFAEVRSYDSSKHLYLMLFIALAQIPLLSWLGNITVNWFF